jgi:16S rRNA (cytosine967-C5)-methyltransferase
MNPSNTNHYFSARAVAAEALRDLDFHKHDIASRLDRLMDKTDQRARATDLVYGVIRNLSAIDLVLRTFTKIKDNHTDKKVLALLRIGVYELVYVAQTPEYAIVNDAVALAAKVSKKTGGFVNAVLRNVQRAIVTRNANLSNQPLRRILPADDKQGCVFNADLLPKPEEGPAEFLAAAQSLPVWLIRQWIIEFGLEQTKSICFACNRRPSVILRPNLLKITLDDLARRLGEEGVDVLPAADGSGLKLQQALNLSRLTAFQEGLFFVQDQAAYDAVNLLPVQNNWVVLDLCAAPGTKTAVLAAKMNNTGTIYATDIDKNRLQKVADNCQRLGITNVKIIEPRQFTQFISQRPHIDAILTDVPCSNTGVLARRVEARWRLEQKAISLLITKQRAILNRAMSLVGTGGVVLYSTCSILADENQNLMRLVMSDYPVAKLKIERLTTPQIQTETAFDHDGGYAALIQAETT